MPAGGAEGARPMGPAPLLSSLLRQRPVLGNERAGGWRAGVRWQFGLLGIRQGASGIPMQLGEMHTVPTAG